MLLKFLLFLLLLLLLTTFVFFSLLFSLWKTKKKIKNLKQFFKKNQQSTNLLFVQLVVVVQLHVVHVQLLCVQPTHLIVPISIENIKRILQLLSLCFTSASRCLVASSRSFAMRAFSSCCRRNIVAAAYTPVPQLSTLAQHHVLALDTPVRAHVSRDPLSHAALELVHRALVSVVVLRVLLVFFVVLLVDVFVPLVVVVVSVVVVSVVVVSVVEHVLHLPLELYAFSIKKTFKK